MKPTYQVHFASDAYSMDTYQTTLAEAKQWVRDHFCDGGRLPNHTEFYL